MSSNQSVFLVRHGEADYQRLADFAPVYNGSRRDFAPLTNRGVRQAEAAAEQLRKEHPSTVITSPYTRTLQTAATIASRLGCELRVEPALHEWLPIPDGASRVTDELMHQKLAEYKVWQRSGVLPPDRTWETDDDMAGRVRAAVARHGTPGSLIVVTHEALIRSATGATVVHLASVHHLAP